MKKTILIFCASALTMLPFEIYGQNISLQECVAKAMENNFSVKISKNNLSIAENNVTLAPFLPNLTLGSKQTKYNYDIKTYDAYGIATDSKSDYNTLNANTSISWTLFDGFSMFATRDKQVELLSQGEFRFRSTAENLVMNISSQYFLIISLQNQVKLLEELVSISSERYSQALMRYKIGKDSGLESKQAKIYLNSDSSKLILQQENVQNAYIKLFEMMNVPLNSPILINDTIIPEPLLSLDNLLNGAFKNNTSLLITKSGQKVSEIDLKLARAARYPTLGFSASYNYNFTQSTLFPSRYNETTGPNMGFSISVPLFNGFETNRKVANAKIGIQNSMLEYEQAKLSLEVDIRQEYNIYTKNLQLIGFEIESQEAAFLNLDAAIEKYRIGSLSGIEFRDFQLSYLDASVRKISSLYQAKLSEITLHLLAGELFK